MKQVATLSVALVAALVGSYLAWTDDGETVDAEQVPLYDASEADLEQIRWNTKTKDITVSKRSDARGDYWWIETVERVVPALPDEPEAPEPTDDDAPEGDDAGEEAPESPADEPASPTDEPTEEEAPPEPTEKRVAFVGSEQAAELWADYAPLVALRELRTDGAVSDATFGLEEPEGTLEVVRRGQTITMEIGGETYGSKDRYVRHNGKTYLVDDGDLRPLQYASTRMVERGLYPYPTSEIASITVTYDGRTEQFVQQNRDDKGKAYWARSATPEEQDDTVETWVGKLTKLRLRAYVDEAEVEGLEPLFAFQAEGAEGSWPVEVLRAPGPTGTYYARTAFNRSLVELTGSVAKNIADDLPEVLPAE
jgi:hypothetical protein